MSPEEAEEIADFLTPLLNFNPSESLVRVLCFSLVLLFSNSFAAKRATARQCLQHPWLAQLYPDERQYSSEQVGYADETRSS